MKRLVFRIIAVVALAFYGGLAAGFLINDPSTQAMGTSSWTAVGAGGDAPNAPMEEARDRRQSR
jgi:hypothetical protein